MPNPDDFYTESQRKLQKENESLKLADTVVKTIVTDEIQEAQIGFIASRDFFFLSTVNGDGEPTVSYKGGPVGMVHVENPKHLVFPSYDGNGMFYSLGNISETNKVGLLFIDMVTPHRVRIQGNASISTDPDLVARFPGAIMVVQVEVTKAFYNCGRYIHKHERVETSKYVPDEKGEQPFPAWKRIDKVQDSLPPKDQGRAEQEGGTITEEEYEEKVMQGTS
ncbi:MAG: pyridoxamine 5'-phosphate oxidase family protein [Gammaproteobacteria bacterium]